jgi:tyrosyl-tRNA synthetase
VALMGGGTTKVGDPSGKDESRKMLTEEMIESNIRASARLSTACCASTTARPARSWSTMTHG